jgi:hypothetical protein
VEKVRTRTVGTLGADGRPLVVPIDALDRIFPTLDVDINAATSTSFVDTLPNLIECSFDVYLAKTNVVY